MDDKTKEELKKAGSHAWHGAEDVAEVLGHGAAGAVKGVADGVETASEQTKERGRAADHAGDDTGSHDQA